MPALGRTGLHVHPLCLGGNVFGWTADEDASFAVLDAYREAGGDFVDTADSYSRWVPGHRGGESERAIGAWLRSRPDARDGLVLATKIGWEGGLSADHVRRSAHMCLERLGVDHVELLYAHRPDDATPLAETLEAFDALVREGVVGHVGLSNHDGARVREALRLCDEHGWAPPAVVQPGLSLVDRDRYLGDLQAVCVEHGLGVAPYAALAGGLLTGAARPGGRAEAKLEAASAEQRATAAAVREVAEARGTDPAAIAVAWVAAQDGVTAPIASATRPEQLEPLLTGATLALTPDELARLT